MGIEVSIKKKFEGFTLDVDFKNSNQKLGILGASGSGKSMTLKCIAGIEKPDTGKIIVNDKVLFDSESKINLPSKDRSVGYLFQNYALFPTMNVEENIGIGIKKKKELKREMVNEKIKEFHLEGLAKRYPSELSGGQQQRVALARMLVTNPYVILLDEPFSALDSFLKEILQQQLLETLESYHGDIIIVSHNRDEVYRLCERMVVIDGGKTVVNGNTKEVFENPRKVAAARLTGCKNISPIRRIDEHTMEALSWGIILKTSQAINENITHVGIRAHDLIPFWDKPGTNFIQYELNGSGSLPFEEHFFIKSRRNDRKEENICWFVQKDRIEKLQQKGSPRYLYFPEDKLLLME